MKLVTGFKIKSTSMDVTVSFSFAWYDMWVGAYYDKKKHALYICLLPCFPICIRVVPLWTPYS